MESNFFESTYFSPQVINYYILRIKIRIYQHFTRVFTCQPTLLTKSKTLLFFHKRPKLKVSSYSVTNFESDTHAKKKT